MEAESSEKETTRNWLELPRELTSAILSKLGTVEILTSAQNVCTTWRNICKDPAMWRRIDMLNVGDRWNMDYNLEVMCFHAVDRSCGDLMSINVEYFGTDGLLKYIADRASSLRQLRLVSCYSISDEGLIGAVAKLSMLEEIEISFCSFPEEVLAAIGRSCPLLKTFKYNSQGFKCPHIEVDEEAQAIAATMHELRHLYLFGNKLTNVGLSTILDGCPHLESLDLRQCFNINLVGELEKRCLERIKDLRRPNDPIDDYEFDASLNCEELSSEEGYPSGFSEIEYLSEDDYLYEFSDGSDDPNDDDVMYDDMFFEP